MKTVAVVLGIVGGFVTLVGLAIPAGIFFHDLGEDVDRMVDSNEDIRIGMGGAVVGIDELARNTGEGLGGVAASIHRVDQYLRQVLVQPGPGFGLAGEAGMMALDPGEPMFCGEDYDPDQYSVSIVGPRLPYFPCGAILRVQNLGAVDDEGGWLATRVRVVDKFPEDPANEQRIVLLSDAAAKQMGLTVEQGVTPVVVTVYAVGSEE